MKVSNYAWGAAALSAGVLLSATGQVAAQQQSASAQAMLEEVIVTARRREETLQDLPLSVAAISADMMQAQGMYNIDQIGEYVPNLTFTTTDRRYRKAIYIRGIGSDTTGSLAPTGTGLYLDGHYLPNTVGQMMSTVDVERIEVLRGPQGTLFGKNTTGGAINIITTKPHDQFEADVLLRAGSYGQQDFKAMINTPFSDTVYGRFHVAKETFDGYYYNRTLNKDVGESDLEAFGAAIRFEPNDNWLIDVGVRLNYQDDSEEGGQCRVAVDQELYDNMVTQHGAAALAAWSPQANGEGQWGGSNANGIVGHLDRLYTGATLDFWNDCTTDNATGDYVNSQEKDTYMYLDNEAFNTTIQWDSAGPVGGLDNLNVKLIASQHGTYRAYIQDRDMSSLSIDAIGSTTTDVDSGNSRETTNVELLFTADVNDRLSFIAGTHYFDDESQNGGLGCLRLFEANLVALSDPLGTTSIQCFADGGTQFDRLADRTAPGGPGVAGMSGRTANESIAVFGHVTFDLSENWTMDIGALWTDEDRLFNQVEFGSDESTCTHTQPGDPPTTALCRPDYFLTYQSVFEDGFYNDVTANYSEVTPMISFTRALGGGDTLEDGMLYFSYAEGFLTGSFNDELNVVAEPALAPLLSYGPEHVDSYEVGFKGTFADGRVRMSSAVFYMDYQDKQEQVTIENDDGRFGSDPSIQLTQNASTVDIYGIELELRVQPWDGGFLTFDVGWLDNEYGEYSAFDPDSGLNIDRSGLTIEDYSPEWTVNAMIEHAFVLGNGATLTPQLGLYYQSDYDFETGIDASGPVSFCHQPSFTKFRTRVTYEPADGNWQASLFGQNINDERYFEICGGSRSGVFDYRYGQPDTWGAEFTYRWGA